MLTFLDSIIIWSGVDLKTISTILVSRGEIRKSIQSFYVRGKKLICVVKEI